MFVLRCVLLLRRGSTDIFTCKLFCVHRVRK